MSSPLERVDGANFPDRVENQPQKKSVENKPKDIIKLEQEIKKIKKEKEQLFLLGGLTVLTAGALFIGAALVGVAGLATIGIGAVALSLYGLGVAPITVGIGICIGAAVIFGIGLGIGKGIHDVEKSIKRREQILASKNAELASMNAQYELQKLRADLATNALLGCQD